MENCIEIQHLQKSFGTVHAVNDLSLQVKQGELFAFLGINGAGKSTTISMLCGQLRQDAGSVRIQGKDTLEDMPQIRQSLGVVFQHSVLDKQLSVLDNLKTRAALYGIAGRAFQERLIELDELLELKLLLKRSVGKLSGGQRRRIDIARAIFHQPQLLILDEPTTGLDPQTRKSVWRVIGELRKKKHMTVFLTTHYMEEAADADHVVILDEGRILAEGTPLELKNRCIRAGAKMAEQEVTAVLSNMSVVKMPEDYAQYIEKFGVYTSTNRTELCICSFQDMLSLGFTSRYDSTNIQRNFYRILKELGASVKVAEPDFPEDARPNYEGKKVLQIFTFCCIAAIVISMMTDIIISPGVHWSVFVAAGCATMWLTMAVGYVKRFNLLKNAAWQLLIMSGICVLWDLGTGWRGWSVNIGIPDICLLIQVVMLIISRIRSLSPREYMIYYVMAAVYSMILPLILLVTGVIHYRTPSVICIGCSFLLLIGLILFKRKEFKEEMHKKFHVG